MISSIPRPAKRFLAARLFLIMLPKTSQSKYSWSQNVVSIGLLKIVKGRWACLPLAFRFYRMRKTIGAENIKVNGKIPPFQTKFDQVVEILPEISAAFSGTPLLVVADSWFDNDESAQAYALNHWAAYAYSFQIARQRHFVCATSRTTETSTRTIQKVWRQDGQCGNVGQRFPGMYDYLFG
jgi:hypothetical protein